jgi:hypothetical protein
MPPRQVARGGTGDRPAFNAAPTVVGSGSSGNRRPTAPVAPVDNFDDRPVGGSRAPKMAATSTSTRTTTAAATRGGRGGGSTTFSVAAPVAGGRGRGASSTASSSSAGGMVSEKALEKAFSGARSTGVLNLGKRGFTSIPEQVFAIHDSSNLGGDEKWWELVDIKCVDLSRNELKVLPERIRNLSQIEVLNLSFNHINELPAELFECNMLKKLELSSNKLTIIPSLVTSLISMVELDLADNGITVLPDGIAALPNLQVLNVDSNGLRSLPRDIGSHFLVAFSLVLAETSVDRSCAINTIELLQ